MDFRNWIGWRVITEVDWNLKHWMHWCKCRDAVFQWKIWIGLEFFTLGNRPKIGRHNLPLELDDDEVHYVGNLNNFSASFYYMYFFNIVKPSYYFHIQYKTANIKFFLLVTCCKIVWKFEWSVFILKPFTLTCMCTFQTGTLIAPPPPPNRWHKLYYPSRICACIFCKRYLWSIWDRSRYI